MIFALILGQCSLLLAVSASILELSNWWIALFTAAGSFFYILALVKWSDHCDQHEHKQMYQVRYWEKYKQKWLAPTFDIRLVHVSAQELSTHDDVQDCYIYDEYNRLIAIYVDGYQVNINDYFKKMSEDVERWTHM